MKQEKLLSSTLGPANFYPMIKSSGFDQKDTKKKNISPCDSFHVFSVEAELQYQARLWGSEEMAHRARHYTLRACTQLEQLRAH